MFQNLPPPWIASTHASFDCCSSVSSSLLVSLNRSNLRVSAFLLVIHCEAHEGFDCVRTAEVPSGFISFRHQAECLLNEQFKLVTRYEFFFLNL